MNIATLNLHEVIRYLGVGAESASSMPAGQNVSVRQVMTKPQVHTPSKPHSHYVGSKEPAKSQVSSYCKVNGMIAITVTLANHESRLQSKRSWQNNHT